MKPLKTKSICFVHQHVLKMVLLLVFITIGHTQDSQAQRSRTLQTQSIARCGVDHYMAQRFSDDPTLEKKFLDLQDKFFDEVSRSIICDGTNDVAIPLAFHFDNDFACADEACMLAKVYEQIDILNVSFADNTSSSNAANCSSAYPAISSGTCISFYLAEPPACANSASTACNAAITVGEFQGGYSGGGNGQGTYGAGACWDDYLNVFIQTNGQGLGVADQIPDALPADGPGEGVSVVAAAFGGQGGPCGNLDTNSTYNLGATLTHEIGHYLGLFHTFQGGCSDEPNNSFNGTAINVDDTPAQQADFYGCPTGCVASGCGGNQQTANIMNYTDDPCMDMFSEDQANAMNVVANGLFGNVSIPAAPTNLTDLLGLCPAGQCQLVCVSQVLTPINTNVSYCTMSETLTLSETGIVVDETSDVVYSWSSGDYLSTGGTPVASTTVPSFMTTDCNITSEIYYLNVDCGTTPLMTTLDGGTFTINVYPGPPADLSSLVTISGENLCDEPIITPIPGCESFVSITNDGTNPSFPVNAGDSGSSNYMLTFTPDPNGPNCCATGSIDELIENGDYEAGPASWTEVEEVPAGTPNPDPFGIIGVSQGYFNGSNDAWFGGWGSEIGQSSVTSSYLEISQTIDIPSTCSALDLSFDYLVECSGNASIEFKVLVGGVEATAFDCSNSSGVFTADLIALGVPTGMQTLLIYGLELDPNPRNNDDAASVFIDNISILPSNCTTTTCDLDIAAMYDCAACPTCFTDLTHGDACDLQTVENAAFIYESSTWIQTSESTVIQTGADIEYSAADYIELNRSYDHEFEVEPGSVFHAFIDGCVTSNVKSSHIQK